MAWVWAGVSISEAADLLGFSRTAVFTRNVLCENQKTSSERLVFGQKCLVGEGGRRRRASGAS